MTLPCIGQSSLLRRIASTNRKRSLVLQPGWSSTTTFTGHPCCSFCHHRQVYHHHPYSTTSALKRIDVDETAISRPVTINKYYVKSAENVSLDRTWKSLDQIPLQQWTLDRLANTTAPTASTTTSNNDSDSWRIVHQEIATLILDVSCRLEQQILLLQTIQQHFQQMRQHPQIQTNKKKSFSTVTNIGRQQRRPYWWSYQKERQLQEEFDKALSTLQDLQRLHQDTLKQSMYQYQQWTASKQQSQTTTTSPTIASWKALTKTFQEIQARHALTVETMAELVVGILHPLQYSSQVTHDIETFLQTRSIIQLLCDHLVQVGKQQLQQQQLQQQMTEGKVAYKATGAVTQNHSVKSIVEAAMFEAGHLCEAHFLTRPQVEFVNAIQGRDGVIVESATNCTNDLQATFIRPWLQYTLVELLKNAMAATIEHPNPKCIGQLSCETNNDQDDEETEITHGHCPIFIHISETDTHVLIQIMDQGGGLAHTNKSIEDIFEFAQCSKKWDRLDDQQTYAMVRSPLRGLGVGLSMSRLQMRHFGGDVVLEDRSNHHHNHDHYVLQVAVGHFHDTPQWYSLESGITATILLSREGKQSANTG
ncbi:hypothetical protein IV203_015091 [Nitzschia inconspicua]|uniref:Protein-serine/threonine kinase n=1 Tax=Nitzschia inconspicua TaxID=303405 RepID=A0A9K3LAJ0_9STRA|nr:hypothetical protein IV203_015091 [Nitzschia inconspicua]